MDKKITNTKELINILNNSAKEKYPIVIVAEDIEQEALAPVIKNKLRGALKVAAIKAPAFGERKTHCLEDIAILTGGRTSNTSTYKLQYVLLLHMFRQQETKTSIRWKFHFYMHSLHL